MAKNNPIECVSLMAHEEDLIVFVHRSNSISHYNCYAHTKRRDKSTRFHRMTKIVTEFLKVTYLRNTGHLAPNSW